jgi:dienelactone hydrolase
MRTRRSIAEYSIGFISGLLLLLATAMSVHAYERVLFPSLDGKTQLTAYLAIPEGEGPFPVVVLLHGCGGMHYAGSVSPFYASWAKLLNDHGFATLTVDSAGPRNLGASCGDRDKRMQMYRERPFDAYGALGFLQSKDFIRPDRIGLLGWSQGGGIVLLTVVSESIARPSPAPRHDYAVAAAFYPALCDDRLQSRPFTNVSPKSWSTTIPLIVLHGESDNWTRPEPCKQFIREVRSRGNPVSITLYPGANHGFDAPGTKTWKLPQYMTADGVIPIVGPDPAARADVRRRLPEFLKTYLSPGKVE